MDSIPSEQLFFCKIGSLKASYLLCATSLTNVHLSTYAAETSRGRAALQRKSLFSSSFLLVVLTWRQSQGIARVVSVVPAND